MHCGISITLPTNATLDNVVDAWVINDLVLKHMSALTMDEEDKEFNVSMPIDSGDELFLWPCAVGHHKRRKNSPYNIAFGCLKFDKLHEEASQAVQVQHQPVWPPHPVPPGFVHICGQLTMLDGTNGGFGCNYTQMHDDLAFRSACEILKICIPDGYDWLAVRAAKLEAMGAHRVAGRLLELPPRPLTMEELKAERKQRIAESLELGNEARMEKYLPSFEEFKDVNEIANPSDLNCIYVFEEGGRCTYDRYEGLQGTTPFCKLCMEMLEFIKKKKTKRVAGEAELMKNAEKRQCV